MVEPVRSPSRPKTQATIYNPNENLAPKSTHSSLPHLSPMRRSGPDSAPLDSHLSGLSLSSLPHLSPHTVARAQWWGPACSGRARRRHLAAGGRVHRRGSATGCCALRQGFEVATRPLRRAQAVARHGHAGSSDDGSRGAPSLLPRWRRGAGTPDPVVEARGEATAVVVGPCGASGLANGLQNRLAGGLLFF